MREQAESRKKLKEGIDKRKTATDDRANHMGLAVDDKKTIADTSQKLRLGGTKEGAGCNEKSYEAISRSNS